MSRLDELAAAAAAAVDSRGRKVPFVFNGLKHINHPGCATGACLCAVFSDARPAVIPSAPASGLMAPGSSVAREDTGPDAEPSQVPLAMAGSGDVFLHDETGAEIVVVEHQRGELLTVQLNKAEGLEPGAITILSLTATGWRFVRNPSNPRPAPFEFKGVCRVCGELVSARGRTIHRECETIE